VGKFSSLEICALSSHWSLQERAAFAFYLEKQNLPQGEPLFFEKASESKLYILDSGTLKIQTAQIELKYQPGESLGELSLLSQTEKKISATALSDCSFWVLTSENWKKIQDRQPLLAKLVVESILKKMGNLMSSLPAIKSA
jgi:SulP family sulfate permease